LDIKRDWGYSPDYVESMWVMLQSNTPEDYVISTGQLHSLKDFLNISFREVGIEDWEPYVKQDPRFMRPAEVDVLRGDSTKAKEELGWKPTTSFDDIVKKMVTRDVELLKTT
jgi:GDPmannose 4,6-dehydratase